jgi:predicted MFS family arabinose efflux permease
MLAMGSNEIFFIVYGDWMEASFGLALGVLGLASGIIGGAEIVGELSAGFLVDRFGKRPVIIITGLLNAATYCAIPFTGNSLVSALVTLLLLFWFFEVTLVGGIPLLTELVPNARSVVMSVTLAAGALGRTIGSLIGPVIFQKWGFPGSGVTAALVMGLGVLVLARWVKEYRV